MDKTDFNFSEFVFLNLLTFLFFGTLLIIVSSITSYRFLSLSSLESINFIPLKYDNYLAVLNASQISNSEEIKLAFDITNQIAEKTYYKNFSFLILDDELNEYNLAEYIPKQSFLSIDEIKFFTLKNKIDFETCKAIAEKLQSTEIVAYGDTTSAQILKLVCNNLGMDIQYLKSKRFEDSFPKADVFMYYYLRNLFFPIIQI